MAITSLGLTNFRSYREHTIELDPVVTLVVGPNATGKTNLLEALYVLATTRSFRAKDAELVHHGEDFYRLAAELSDGPISLGYRVGETGTEKRVRHGDTPRSLIDHLGRLRVVLFEPNDLLLVFGAPERRRRYLDGILSQTDQRYTKTLTHYRRILQQRNRVLADWRGNPSDLFAWDIQLADCATEIDQRRRAAVDHINRLVCNLYADIAGSPIKLSIIYRGVAETDYATTFLQLLERCQRHDIAAGFTTIGPHRDDFSIEFKGAEIATVASRGEIRTTILALKLAELAYIEQATNSKPLLLLDDVFSELDDARRQYLLQTLAGRQSLVTTTNADVGGELSAHHTTIHTSELQRV